MTSCLSSDDIEQLAPLLGSLSRLIAAGSQLQEHELKVLLLSTDMDYDALLLKELKLWGKLLMSVREQPTSEMRHVTVEALLLRSLPEASALLAIDTVTADVSQPIVSSYISPIQQLKVHPTNVDFGTLSPGQIAVREFEIQGGPGQIVVESDQLQVTPLRFTADTTRIRVQVSPMATGLLWTSLRLVTQSQTVEIPVLAQWSDAGTTAYYQQVVDSEPALDLTGMIEQAMGISSSSTQTSQGMTPASPTSSTQSQKSQTGANSDTEILEQLRHLFD